MTTNLDIVLAAHGAGDGSAANALVRSCAQRIEAGTCGVRVTAAFRLGTPTYAAALHDADRRDVLVVPLLTSDGYFARSLRREIRRLSHRAKAPTVLAPFGTNQRFLQAVADEVAAVARRRAAAEGPKTVVVVAHGTRRCIEGGAAALAVAKAIARRCGLAAHAAYLEQDPTIEDVVSSVPRDADLLIVPFLLGGGAHAVRDVPSRIAAAAATRGIPEDRVTLVEPLQGLSALTRLVKDIIDEARG
ncbi:MAG: CbiX/SirB N-terminal domain-containing protein [Gemmatimonadaceae bacterium]